MTVLRALSGFCLFAALFGCGLFGSPSPDQLAQLMQERKLPIYFAGAAVPPPYQQRLGPATGASCQTTLLGASPTEEAALQSLWSNASGQNPTAIVDVTCSSTSIIRTWSPCVPGIVCKGVAVR